MIRPLRAAAVLGLAGCGWLRGATSADCVTWQGDPVQLSPRRPEPRHHATAAFLSTGDVMVSWQVGKTPAFVATRTFTDRLQTRTREGRIDDMDSRATHPQLAVGPDDVVSMLWTDEVSGALAWRPLDGNGEPRAPALDLRGDGAERPALYGDLSYGPQGDLVATWFTEPARWSVARLDGKRWARQALPTLPDTHIGGPGAVAHAPDGTAWVAWPERAGAQGEGGTATLRAATLTGDTLSAPLTLLQTDDNAQRLALAFAGGDVVTAWTRYPTQDGAWGVFLGTWHPDGTPASPPRQLGGDGARMVDIATLDDLVFAAWEAPAGDDRHDLWIQAFDPSGAPRCTPQRVHGPDDLDDTRANLAVRRDADGRVHGVVVWQRGPTNSRDAVWGHRFTR